MSAYIIVMIIETDDDECQDGTYLIRQMENTSRLF